MKPLKSKKYKWGVVVGRPKDKRPLESWERKMMGRWVLGLDILLVNTRAEARLMAKSLSDHNRYWNYHPKKYTKKKF